MSKRVAIMDYGIGGLGLFRKLKQLRPAMGITYFSDSGEVPYGKLPQKQLYERVCKVINFLKSQGADIVIVACHAASSVSTLLDDDDVIDMIGCTKALTTNAHIRDLGIIGGGRTIRSGIYSKHFRDQGVHVAQRIAQPLSILIESGEVDSKSVDVEIEKILSPIKHVDGLLLACTHYPVLNGKIKEFLGDKCEVIDPIDQLLESIHPIIKDFKEGEDVFYTTGDDKLMTSVAASIYDIQIGTPIKLAVDLKGQ